MHKLTEIDPDKRTAICRECGPTHITIKERATDGTVRRWSCPALKAGEYVRVARGSCGCGKPSTGSLTPSGGPMVCDRCRIFIEVTAESQGDVIFAHHLAQLRRDFASVPTTVRQKKAVVDTSGPVDVQIADPHQRLLALQSQLPNASTWTIEQRGWFSELLRDATTAAS